MIIGIDPGSTKLAVCLDERTEGRVSFYETKLPSPYRPQTCGLAAQWLRDIFSSLNTSVSCKAFLEAPIMVRNTQSTLKQAMVSGAIQATLDDLGIDVYLVPVTQWKKEIIGKGNASKAEVSEWVEKKYPKLKGESQDMKDSFCLYLYGQSVVERAESV